MKKIKLLTALAVILPLMFAGCSNGSSDDTSSSGSSGSPLDLKSIGMSFNTSNAKAFATVSSENSSSDMDDFNSDTRAAGTTNSELLKILEDGRFEEVITVPEKLNYFSVAAVVKNPVKDDFYIITDRFTTFGKYDSASQKNIQYCLGNILAVHSDGTFNDVLGNSKLPIDQSPMYDSSGSLLYETITFDASGNIYFISQPKNSTNYVLKYDSTNDNLTKLASVKSPVSKYKVDKEGKWVFVLDELNIVKAIPMSNPENPVTLISDISNTYGINGFTYDDVSDAVYIISMSGQKIIKFYKNDSGIYSENSKTVVHRFGECNLLHDNLIESDNNNGYKWSSSYLNADGSPDSKKILDYFFSFCTVAAEKEFKLTEFQNTTGYTELYSTATDEKAIAWLSDDTSRLKKLYEYSNSGNNEIIKTTCFNKETGTSAYTSKSYNSIIGINNFISNSCGIWVRCNLNPKNYYIKLYGTSRTYAEETVENLLPGDAVKIFASGSKFYYRNPILTASGDETGYQNIMCADMSDGTTKNIFVNTPYPESTEITSYNIGNNILYFSGVKGLTIINGKINLDTLEYTQISSGKKLSSIVVLK